MTYWSPTGGLPAQTQLLTDRAMFREAYAVIPRGTNSDIVTSYLPHWQGTRLWVLARPLSGFAETFSQYMMEVSPGGGSDRPELDPDATVDYMRGFTGTGTNAGNCCTTSDPAAVAAAAGYDDVIVYAGMDSTASSGTFAPTTDSAPISTPCVTPPPKRRTSCATRVHPRRRSRRWRASTPWQTTSRRCVT